MFKGDLKKNLEGDLELDLEGEKEGDSKGDFRGDFKQDMKGDLLLSSGQVQVWSRSVSGYSSNLILKSLTLMFVVGQLVLQFEQSLNELQFSCISHLIPHSVMLK